MSKLPTSRLKLPTKFGVIHENKIIQEDTEKTGKSYPNISARVFTNLTTTSTARAFPRRRSKSVTDLRAPISSTDLPKTRIIKNGGDENIKPNKQPIKRQAVASVNTDVQKKKMKIPSWDYKSRYQQLSEEYKTLQQANMENYLKIQENGELKQTVETLNKNLAISRAETERLTIANAEYVEKNSKMESELKQLKEDFSVLNEAYELEKQLRIEKEKISQNQSVQLLDIQNILEEVKTEKVNLAKKCEKMETTINRLITEVEKHEFLRRSLHNTIQDLKGNIRVFCRVRPPITLSEQERLQCLLNYPTETSLEIRKSRDSINVITGKSNDLKQEFIFDQVFPPEATQDEVFKELSQLVQSALDGYNVCVFAYGQTGSGKTYTMQGTEKDAGMIPKTIDLIFTEIDRLHETNWDYTVEASFLEIYNENIKDLLQPNSNVNYDIKYNEGKGITITNLTAVPVKSAYGLKTLMDSAHSNRAVAATDFNEHSSRSHAVTKINLKGLNKKNNCTYLGSISLVDLAGSESAKTTSNERLQETKNINKSLSALGTVMKALHNRESHIPYRNSKLTFLLQSSLGGNSKTLMFVNISPFEDCFAESVNSLRFASQVKEVKTSSKKNRL